MMRSLMKHAVTILGLSVLLAACSVPSYEAGVDTSEILDDQELTNDVSFERSAQLQTYWNDNISNNIVQFNCIVCHSDSSIAGQTRWVMLANNQDDYLEINLTRTLAYIAAAEANGQNVINKSQGVNHGGGAVLAAGSADAEKLSGLIELATSTNLDQPEIPKNDDTNTSDVLSATRQAAMDFYINNLENALIQPDCYVCHQSNGVAKNSDLIFIANNVNDYENFNANTVIDYTRASNSNFNNFLLKPIGQGHGGKQIIEVTSNSASNISTLLELVESIVDTPESNVASPSNVQASVLLGEVFFAWEMNGEHDGFEVQRKQNNGEWSTVATLSKDESLYRDSAVSQNEEYQYRIRAELVSEYSEYSETVTVTIN